MTTTGRWAPNYVYPERGPGVLGGAWWVVSILLVLDLPIGLLLGEVTAGWWSMPVGIASWVLYSLWRVETTHIWHSDLARATIGRLVYRRYPSLDDVRTGDYA
jgi:hypothetical protein